MTTPLTRLRHHGLKLHQGKFRLDIKKRFFPERVVGHWSRLLRKAVEATTLSEFKMHLDDSQSYSLALGIPVRNNLNSVIHRSPFQLRITELFWLEEMFKIFKSNC